jgi:tetratricopeptide (TPR) repeat protein
MTLPPTLLRELEHPKLTVDRRAELCCDAAKELENKGEYEQAQQIVGTYWERIGEHPKVAGLEPGTAAEVLLRAGVLTGIVGTQNRIADAQERAKDLLTESHAVFESQRNGKKIAEVQTELALCYWRTGEIEEARDLLKQALSFLTIDSELKAKAIIRMAIVERGAARHDKALRLLTNYAPLFDRIHNETLKGSYHDTLGNALEDLSVLKQRSDYVDRALIEYAASSYHFEQAGHKGYLASVENNLGVLYFKINRCDEAHEHLDRARRIFASLKDAGTVAQVDETRACVFLQQGRVVEAERVARSAVRNQEKTGRHALLAEALVTHGKALARLKRYSAGLFAFRRAFDLSQHSGNVTRAADAALAAFQEIADRLVVSEGGPPSSGRGWSHDKRAMEHDLIKLALEQANGSITHAAYNLGISYPSLSYMLRTRYKDLLNERTPIRRRPRKNSPSVGSFGLPN